MSLNTPQQPGLPRNIAAWILLVIGLVNLGRGGGHFLLPDGGAAAAGMRLADASGPDLIYVFGVSGAFEILLALWMIFLALRQPALLGLGLWTQIAKSGLVLLLGYSLKPPVGPPPGQLPDWATLLAAVLGLLFLLRFSRSRATEQRQAQD